MVSIIVACDPNGVIGKNNTIPWYISDDLKLFKKRTLGHSIIMGRRTWDSLPRRPLLGRINYVISHTQHPCPHTCLAESLAGPIWCSSIQIAIEDAHKNHNEGKEREIFIIGGEQIYNEALQADLVENIIMSRIHKAYEGDRYFHLPENWVESVIEKHEDFDVVYFVKSKQR